MMAAASTSETSVNFYQTTRRYIEETATFILDTVNTTDVTTALLK
jgi:hypothetical protein